ncbi:MAG TPA: VWA domain-containing protein [Vicinamibacterales bacterium]|nr:VWA domain-containing protein [Vicinamibacterales bacterium]
MTPLRVHSSVFAVACWSAVCAATLIIAQGAPSPPNDQQGQSPPTFSSSVRRVVLYATVRSRDGFVADLTRTDFTVLEEGKPQEILEFTREDVPVAIGLLVDNSGSMSGKRAEVVAAAKAFVRATNPRDDIFVLHFNEHLAYGLPADVPFTGDRVLLDEALDRMTLEGQTALYSAILEGLAHLNESKLTKKALIVISDGRDNASRLRLDDVVKRADLSGASFYAIGIYDREDDDADPRTLRNLANRTGGEAFFPERLEDVRALCERIALTLRNQYSLSYSPPSWDSGPEYRRLEVTVKDPKRRNLTVRTRTGYYTTSGSPQE